MWELILTWEMFSLISKALGLFWRVLNLTRKRSILLPGENNSFFAELAPIAWSTCKTWRGHSTIFMSWKGRWGLQLHGCRSLVMPSVNQRNCWAVSPLQRHWIALFISKTKTLDGLSTENSKGQRTSKKGSTIPLRSGIHDAAQAGIQTAIFFCDFIKNAFQRTPKR